jgi:hypothetical protein
MLLVSFVLEISSATGSAHGLAQYHRFQNPKASYISPPIFQDGGSGNLDSASFIRSKSRTTLGKLVIKLFPIVAHWAPCPVNTKITSGRAFGALLDPENIGVARPSVTANER